MPLRLLGRAGLHHRHAGLCGRLRGGRGYIAELAERFRVEAIAIDRWNSTGTQTRLQEIGLPVVTFGQGFASMSPACKEVERLILNRQLAHDGNPVMRWCLGNVAIAQDPAGNIKIDRQKAKEKVDGAVALAMAIGVASCRAGRVDIRGAAELPVRLTHRKTIAGWRRIPMDGPGPLRSIPTVAAVAEILARAPRSQPWRHEAPCRALIRSLLCLDGDKWWHADRVAFVTVAKARIEVGIRAPVGGDSDFDLSSWIELANCAICDRPFVPHRPSQECCSYACHKRQRYLETRPVRLARCEHCRDPMDVAQPSQKYRSTRCRKAASYLRTKQEWGRVRYCRTCNGPISDSLRGDSLYCSEVCRNKWHRDLPGKLEARREAYRQAADVVSKPAASSAASLCPTAQRPPQVLLARLQCSELPGPQGERPRRAKRTCR